MLSGRLAKWMLLLSEYAITYEPVRLVKGQAVADFLAAHPVIDSKAIFDEFPNEQVMMIELPNVWQMFFDGAAQAIAASAGVIFITPQSNLLPYSFTLGTACRNNEAKYNALIIRMETFQIYGDFKLVINQLTTEFETWKQELLSYCRRAQRLLEQFLNVEIKHIPWYENAKSDALASLATMLSCPD
ncbi:uncharacterized protein LOC131249675 [Magnolia sinica]|uniref:uncharacterized protein LOC131249675 n=1 Tax=Magnolia sinica TaxID=86752 RepID=UPI0026594773|nr:uncharacterized protein LOC131249675 [Magnolia sinica]